MKVKILSALTMSILLFIGSILPMATASEPMKGTVKVLDRDKIKIHVYISPEESNLNATYAIESKNRLVLVDAQFLVPYAQEYRQYIDGLKKPIDRMIISHSHPDHYWGLAAAFGDVETFALKSTIAAIRTNGPGLLEARKSKMGALAPSRIIVPANVLEPGTIIIDGVTYLFEHYTDGEDTDQLVIKLPDQKVIIVQDLAYNKVHLFTAAKLDPWIRILETFQALVGFDTVLVGHGEPADTRIFAANIDYLQNCKAVLESATNAKDFAAQLTQKYPEYRGRLHHLSGSILFSKK